MKTHVSAYYPTLFVIMDNKITFPFICMVLSAKIISYSAVCAYLYQEENGISRQTLHELNVINILHIILS
jgi:hypothetical protein